MLDLFREILKIGDASIDQAMAAALPTADSATRRLMALGLIKRRHPASLVNLVVHFHLLPEDVQQTITHHLSLLTTALRHASHRKDTHGPANALTIIERGRAASMGYLIVDMLRHGEPALRAQAATTLLGMARAAITHAEPDIYPRMSAAETEKLFTPVTEAIECYPVHKQTEVLLSMIALLPRPIHEAMAELAKADPATVKVMLQILSRADQQALIRQSLVLFLAIKPFRAMALSAIRSCMRKENFGELLGNYHLLLLPSVHQPLIQDRDPASLCPRSSAVQALPAHQRRGFLTWMDALGLDLQARVEKLDGLSQSRDPALRLGALQRMIAISHSPDSPENTLDKIAVFVLDTDVHIARIALWELIRRKYPRLMHVLGEALSSRHTSLRRIAGKHISPLGFARLWKSWSTMPASRRLAVGRALIKIDPEFHRQLGMKLAHPVQEDRLRALSMIRELNQGEFFETELVHLINDDNAKVASAATRVLGTVATESAIESLEKALEHSDSRVRANAIESFSLAKSTKHMKQLMSMAESEDNRPRANAIGALMQMRTNEAIPALKQMLFDKRSEHRVSALWLVNEMGLIEMMRQVAEMSISDDNNQVKQRATQVTRKLLRMMAKPDDDREQEVDQ